MGHSRQLVFMIVVRMAMGDVETTERSTRGWRPRNMSVEALIRRLQLYRVHTFIVDPYIQFKAFGELKVTRRCTLEECCLPVSIGNLAVWYRMWWLIPTAVLAGMGEVIGWSGRLWSSLNLPLNTPFLIQ